MFSILLIFISIFQAINMGASGISVSFATSYGSKLLSWRTIIVVFTLFVFLGAVSLGGYVVETISSKIVPKSLLSERIVFIILISDAVALFTSNILRVPASTSVCLVMSFFGVGLFYSKVYYAKLFFMFVVWIISMLFTYSLSYFLTKLFFPPNYKNLWFYERFLGKKSFLRWFVNTINAYKAFGIGSNNVANVVGPLYSAGLVGIVPGLMIFSFVFGLGGLMLGRNITRMVGEEIIPIGIFSASIVSFVVGSISIISSAIGLPVPIAIYSSSAIMGVAIAKGELPHLYSINNNPAIKRILMVWLFSLISPAIISFVITFISNMLRIL